MAVKITLQFSLKQLQLLLLFFFLFSISATSLTFNFPSFPPAVTNNLFIEGDASLDGSLRLAFDDKLSVGRATFSEPFLLRQNSTGKLADFTSTFTFVIDSKNNPNYGDGLVFFLAPAGSKLNRKLGVASCLGLPVYSNLSTQYEFVAVEFDIYPNMIESIDWGHNYTHVGIDINSVNSSTTEPWSGGIMEGKRNNATINYNSTSKNLSVAFTTFENGVQVIRNISFIVDLLQYLPETVIVGFSASTGGSFALHQIISWNFTSTSLQNAAALVTSGQTSNNESQVVLPAPGPSSKAESTKHRIPPTVVIVSITIGGIILLGLFVWFMLRIRKSEIEKSIDYQHMIRDQNADQFEKLGPRKFSYMELSLATSKFDEGNKLGEGGFGKVYKGRIDDLNLDVAVKKISPGSRQGRKEYEAEVKIISTLRHRHLVQLIGWCHENEEFLLVYNFIRNGSLDTHLFKETTLSWEVRYRIVKQLASVIHYLQEQCGDQYVVHRDIKSSNIMLELDFTAKLGDFGLARLLDHGQPLQTISYGGTEGYMAPEYETSKLATKKSDVYSFGIVALEIACGRRPIVDNPEIGKSKIVEWVWELYGENKVIEAADPKLRGNFDKKEMKHLMVVGLWCAHPDPNDRASIEKAIEVLNSCSAQQLQCSITRLPDLPPKMPVATFPPT